MTYTASAVVAQTFNFGIFTFTMNLSGVAATDEAVAAAAGKAVAFDATAPNTVKLAGDGDAIYGRIFQAENRAVLGIRVAAVERKYRAQLPTAAGYTTPAVGDRVIGGGNGTVKKATANAGAGVPTDPLVIEVGTGYVVVEAL